MDKLKKKTSRGVNTKRWVGLALVIAAALIFLLACIPSFLKIGAFFQGVFGITIYPLCVLVALVGIAFMLNLTYTFDKKFTAYLVIAIICLLGLFHAIFTSKVMLGDYKNFSAFGAYLKSCFSLEHGITVGGALLGILVFLLRGIVGVGGTYVIFAILATIFIGLIIDYLVYSRKRRQKRAAAAASGEPQSIDEKSGISTEEYSFSNPNSASTFHSFKEFDEANSQPLAEGSAPLENLFEPEESLDFSFTTTEESEAQKTQNDNRETAKSVLFGSNSDENDQKNEENEPEEPKSAHEILFGSEPKVPNIFDRSSDDRDAWKRQYASKPLAYSENETPAEQEEKPLREYDKTDDGAIKTSWGEYRPTSNFNQNSTINDIEEGSRLDARINRNREFSREREVNRDRDIGRREFSREGAQQERDLGVVSEQPLGAKNDDEPMQSRMRERDIRRTSLSNFNRENSEKPLESTEFSSRLNDRRTSSDILANASSLGIEAKEPQMGGGFASILDSSRRVQREERPAQPVQRESLAKQVGPYVPPPTSILKIYKEDHEDYSEEYKLKSEILESTLSAFKIPAKVINVVRGPKVTRYELTMPTGIPVSKILSYDKDMSMNLASRSGVRIEAPIPGKNAFGVEVENTKSSTVGLRELVESPEFVNFKGALGVAVGKNISGEVIIKSLAKMVHLLVAGSTGSGKSVFLHSVIMSLMYRYSPEELRFIMIDPKRVEFSRYNRMPHMMLPEIVNDCSKAVNALSWAVKEMERRYDLLERNRCQKLEQFNVCPAVKNGEEKKLPYLVIIVDELAELMNVAKKDVETKIQRITQLGRAAGIHMVVATQRPSVDVITGVIKNNLPTRVAFALSSAADSGTVINQGGAEKLLGQGDMLLSAQDSNQIVRLQAAFVSDEEIEKTLDFIKAHNESVYDEEVQKIIYAEPEKEEDKADEGEGGGSAEKMDELMPKVLKLVMKVGKASTSMIQRKFSIGYSRAGRIVDQMEDLGFIDSGIGNKPRDVKITMEQYNELFGNVDDDE